MTTWPVNPYAHAGAETRRKRDGRVLHAEDEAANEKETVNVNDAMTLLNIKAKNRGIRFEDYVVDRRNGY